MSTDAQQFREILDGYGWDGEYVLSCHKTIHFDIMFDDLDTLCEKLTSTCADYKPIRTEE